jgi:type IV secretory pathway VirB3-like protein
MENKIPKIIKTIFIFFLILIISIYLLVNLFLFIAPYLGFKTDIFYSEKINNSHAKCGKMPNQGYYEIQECGYDLRLMEK